MREILHLLIGTPLMPDPVFAAIHRLGRRELVRLKREAERLGLGEAEGLRLTPEEIAFEIEDTPEAAAADEATIRGHCGRWGADYAGVFLDPLREARDRLRQLAASAHAPRSTEVN